MHSTMVSKLMYMCLVESVSTPVPPSWQASQALGAEGGYEGLLCTCVCRARVVCFIFDSFEEVLGMTSSGEGSPFLLTSFASRSFTGVGREHG